MHEQRFPAAIGSIGAAGSWIRAVADVCCPRLADQAETLVRQLMIGALRRACAKEPITMSAAPSSAVLRVEARFRHLRPGGREWAAISALTTRFGAEGDDRSRRVWAELPAEPPLIPRLPLYDTWRDEQGYHARLREALPPSALGHGCAQEVRAGTPEGLIRAAVRNQAAVWRWQCSWSDAGRRG
ncbi:hypothetical protein MF672_045625 [Actinomadura sp. ATCC 31491]|uniref:Uncharacterized protein n=1 Tax=Actinomadura luzonensis TaxID=2805427 RepID=A0ABT0G8X6_9ACTN|nr:hypothetical protein [Actinomadura luzonensis]MCK2221037.1 hypothetical protein [Actinomadura luzonensis]